VAFRLFVFLLCLGAGGAIGWMLGDDGGAQAGLALGALAWFTLESTNALRALRWLRAAEPGEVPRLRGAWGEAVDRTRRALAVRERQLKEAERRLDEFLEAIRGSPNGVVLLDGEGRIEWCNDTAASHLGLDPERDLQQHMGNLLRDPDFSAFFSGRNYGSDVVILAPGSLPSRARRLSLRLHPYGQGKLLLLSRDVTAVEQAEVMRRDFVANVSHEIRTPLTVLSGFVETLQTLDLPREERTRYLKMMGQQTQRMQTLVNDLLTLSRLEGSPLPGSAEWTPVASFLAQCEQEARALATSMGKAMELRFTARAELAISGTPGELQSAFSNLVSNAVRYTPAGGRVEVDVDVNAEQRLEFSVRDTGPGIAAEHLPRLTERFYRVDRSRSRETGGTGLGLAIVKHVVQRHGGELKIASTPGAGSTFTITLPAARMRPVEVSVAGTGEWPATESAAG
jgi:two-component system phosphate regulon sensor histidine kinase PhoR